ncbi:MAG TPA: asparagine synthase-related protein [Candidatus Binatia bacterium]
MICGFFAKEVFRLEPETIYRMLDTDTASRANSQVATHPMGALGCVTDSSQAGRSGMPRLAGEAPGKNCAGWEGEIYNRGELLLHLNVTGNAAQQITDPDILLMLYEAHGLSCVDKINGSFAFALYDAARREVVLGRDRFGIRTLYYYDSPKFTVFGTSLPPILAYPGVPKELNQAALRRYLVFGFNPASDTFFRGVKKLRPGRLLVFGCKAATEKRYWYLSFQQANEKPVSQYCQDILDLTRDSIRLRLSQSESLGIFLSGGMDSSSVAGLTHEIGKKDFSTYSYRCLGKSFDESPYARVMAKHCNAEHHEVVFEPADVRKMESMVRLMDEPLCNAGITIATFLLGQAAERKVARVFSGDGGDELFGGHPVYAADKIAAEFERIPAVFRLPAVALLRYLPDSEQKLNLTVKLKRFAESVNYPKELGTYRWRIQYGPAELNSLLHNGTAGGRSDSELFEELFELTEEADGSDMLSRSLYVDTMTEVGFYLRRMDLIRSFNITPVFPLLDHRLFEYAAGIPSNLKFRDAANTKVIQHRAMEGVLPEEIVNRKDKLGHSIPLKNWLRSDTLVKSFVHDTLLENGMEKRGIIDSKYVQHLWDNHQSSRQNNSHRLWSLTVLELWLRANGL